MIVAKSKMKDLPKTCSECSFCKTFGFVGAIYCKVLDSYFSVNSYLTQDQRPGACPLVEKEEDKHESKISFISFRIGENKEITINIYNVTDISPSKKEGSTDIYCVSHHDCCICVDEPYQQVKDKIMKVLRMKYD